MTVCYNLSLAKLNKVVICLVVYRLLMTNWQIISVKRKQRKFLSSGHEKFLSRVPSLLWGRDKTTFVIVCCLSVFQVCIRLSSVCVLKALRQN